MNKMQKFKWAAGACLLAGSTAFGAQPLVLDMVHHNPGDKLYDSAYVDPAVIKEMGYNGKVYFLFESPALAINWESVDKDILPKGSPDREWVDAKAAQIRKMHADCKAQNIMTYAMSDLVLFPKRLIAKYGIEKTFGDPKKPLVEKLLRAQINEMFDQFPDFDGLVVRIGETYLQDAPYHKGHIEDKTNPEKTIIPLMQILREEICVKRNKQLIFRTWRAFDDNAARYEAVSAAVEPHENLVISIKHCEGDFFRTKPFSKCIGMGRHRQIIEVQCAREYEGKGAYPNYVANGVIEGFEEHSKMAADKINSLRSFYETTPNLFGGIWTWTRGGGWNGPYIKNEMWCDLNAWVTAQWALNPSQSEASIFDRYATQRLKLKGADVAKFRKLCLRSADAVIRGRYTDRGGIPYLWTRDQGIGWPKLRTVPALLKKNLAQKDESIAIWKEIVALAESMDWADKKMRDHGIGSAKYGLRLYEIYRSVINLAAAESKSDEAGMRKWITAYDLAWANYNQLPAEYPSVASLYTQDYKMRANAHKKINQLREQLGMSAAPVTAAAPAKPANAAIELFSVRTATPSPDKSKKFTPTHITIASDSHVIAPASGAEFKKGSTLPLLINSAWDGFSVANRVGAKIDTAAEFQRGYLSFTVTAKPGSKLDCSELTFSSARGGSSKTRGFALYAAVNGAKFSVDDSPIAATDNETGSREKPRNVSVDLSDDAFQGIDSISFRYYPLTPSPGYSMGLGDLILRGSVSK